jgi:hypothetical protein
MDTNPEENPIVGDDGELIQADPKASPIKYAEFVEQSELPPLIGRLTAVISPSSVARISSSGRRN